MPVSGWESPHSSQRAAESEQPAGRKGEDGAMDGREEEEEEEEASSSCFPREDSCDTGEQDRNKSSGPRTESADKVCCFHWGKGQNLPGNVLNHEIIPE